MASLGSEFLTFGSYVSVIVLLGGIIYRLFVRPWIGVTFSGNTKEEVVRPGKLTTLNVVIRNRGFRGLTLEPIMMYPPTELNVHNVSIDGTDVNVNATEVDTKEWGHSRVFRVPAKFPMTHGEADTISLTVSPVSGGRKKVELGIALWLDPQTSRKHTLYIDIP